MCTSALSKGDECSHLQSHNNFCCSTPKWLNFTSAATCNTQPHKMCCMHSSAATAMPDNWTSTIEPPPNRQHSEALRARKASRTGTSRHSGELPPRATARHRTSTAKSTATAKPSEPEKPKPHKQQQAQWETEKQGNGPPPDTKAVKQQHGKQQQRHSQGPADKHGSRNSGSDRALDMLLHHETNSASCSFVENPLMRLWLQRWMWCCGRTAAAERRRATGRRRIAPAVATARRKQ